MSLLSSSLRERERERQRIQVLTVTPVRRKHLRFLGGPALILGWGGVGGGVGLLIHMGSTPLPSTLLVGNMHS